METLLAVRRVKYSIAFFFSSRRRHTRYWRDWSSDVCSSDLGKEPRGYVFLHLLRANYQGQQNRCDERGEKPMAMRAEGAAGQDRKSGGWGKRGDFGGRRSIKKKTRPCVWRVRTRSTA